MAVGDLITQDGQMQWGDLLLGEESPFVGENLTGWDDLPEVSGGISLRPTGHGGWATPLFAEPRVLEWDFYVLPDTLDVYPDTVRRLRQATTLRQYEQPLVVQLAGTRRMTMGRVTRRSLPASTKYTVGDAPDGTLVWECSDPRWYEVDEQLAWTGLPMAEPGLDWGTTPAGLEYPLEWGTPGSTGLVAAYNAGDAATHPVIEIRGPVQRPSVTQIETGRVLEYNVTLTDSDVLVVDCLAGTVTLNGVASRLSTVTTRSHPEQAFALERGTTNLAFRALPGYFDPLSTAVVRWRNAFW
ncbi:phage tail protein [Streptomyces sp. NPDC088183]|uniref:phage distal tail protein n=1 Tax=Streptomyces sp. NPDC088183 TaxID=3160992 RepID=UPI00342B4343